MKLSPVHFTHKNDITEDLLKFPTQALIKYAQQPYCLLAPDVKNIFIYQQNNIHVTSYEQIKGNLCLTIEIVAHGNPLNGQKYTLYLANDPIRVIAITHVIEDY